MEPFVKRGHGVSIPTRRARKGKCEGAARFSAKDKNEDGVGKVSDGLRKESKHFVGAGRPRGAGGCAYVLFDELIGA